MNLRLKIFLFINNLGRISNSSFYDEIQYEIRASLYL